jgi:hypothetical protein
MSLEQHDSQTQWEPSAELEARRAFETRLVEAVWRNPAIRERLRQDPRSVIEELVGVTVPSQMELTIVEETPTKVCLVIPVNPHELEDLPLSEQELAAASEIGFCHITDHQNYGTC